MDSSSRNVWESDIRITEYMKCMFYNERWHPLQVVEGTTNVVLEQAGGGTVAVQLAGADLARLSSMGHEIMGELDPETGIFYTTGTSSADSTEIPTGVTMNPAPMPRVAPVKEGVDSTTSASKPIDFLSW